MKAALIVAAVLVVLAAGGADARDAFAPEPSYADFGPALSPDGTRLAFLREGITSSRLVRYQSLYVARRDGRDAVALTKGALQSDENIGAGHFDGVGSMSWSPDGTQLVYSHVYSGTRSDYVHSELVIVDADGTHPRQLTTTDEGSGFMRATWPSWSPAGDKIVFAAAGRIEVVNADGSGLRQLTPGAYDSDPAWSPDGVEDCVHHRRRRPRVRDESRWKRRADGARRSRPGTLPGRPTAARSSSAPRKAAAPTSTRCAPTGRSSAA